MTSIHQGMLLEMIKKDLSLHSHQIKIGALKVLGTGTHVLSAQDRSLANNIMVMINRHTKNQGKGPFKYYVSMFLAFLGRPTHLRQHK